jgi:hypothetical protein
MWQISVLGIDADLDRYCVFVRVLLDKVCGPLVCEDDREVGEIRVRGAADELGCREEAASAMKSLKRRNILDRNFGGDLDEIFFLAMREKSMPRRYSRLHCIWVTYWISRHCGVLRICMRIDLDVEMGRTSDRSLEGR